MNSPLTGLRGKVAVRSQAQNSVKWNLFNFKNSYKIYQKRFIFLSRTYEIQNKNVMERQRATVSVS